MTLYSRWILSLNSCLERCWGFYVLGSNLRIEFTATLITRRMLFLRMKCLKIHGGQEDNVFISLRSQELVSTFSPIPKKVLELKNECYTQGISELSKALIWHRSCPFSTKSFYCKQKFGDRISSSLHLGAAYRFRKSLVRLVARLSLNIEGKFFFSALSSLPSTKEDKPIQSFFFHVIDECLWNAHICMLRPLLLPPKCIRIMRWGFLLGWYHIQMKL